MTPQDTFETALQRYAQAVQEYKLAWRTYVETVGLPAAQPTLEAAFARICALDNAPMVLLSQEEVDAAARYGVSVVDADTSYSSPDLYGGRIP